MRSDKRIKNIHGEGYSLFQLPENDIMRLKILKFFKKKQKFYFANENFIFLQKRFKKIREHLEN